MALVRIGGNAFDLADIQAIVKLPGRSKGENGVTVMVRNGTPVQVKGEDAAALLRFVALLPDFGSHQPDLLSAIPEVGRANQK